MVRSGKKGRGGRCGAFLGHNLSLRGLFSCLFRWGREVFLKLYHGSASMVQGDQLGCVQACSALGLADADDRARRAYGAWQQKIIGTRWGSILLTVPRNYFAPEETDSVSLHAVKFLYFRETTQTMVSTWSKLICPGGERAIWRLLPRSICCCVMFTKCESSPPRKVAGFGQHVGD